MENPAVTIKRAIELLGSERKLGEASGFSQVAINKAKHRGRVSADMAVRIEKATAGQIARWQMRPDLWDAPATTPEAA